MRLGAVAAGFRFLRRRRPFGLVILVSGTRCRGRSLSPSSAHAPGAASIDEFGALADRLNIVVPDL